MFGPGPGPGLVDLYCKKENGSLCLVSWSISINGTGKARTHIVENNNYDEIRILNRERYIRPPRPLSLNLSISYSSLSLSLFHCLFPSTYTQTTTTIVAMSDSVTPQTPSQFGENKGIKFTFKTGNARYQCVLQDRAH